MFRPESPSRSDVVSETNSAAALPSDLIASLYDKDAIPLFSTRSGDVNVPSLDFSANPYVSLFNTDANTFPPSQSEKIQVASLPGYDIRVQDLPLYEGPVERPVEQPSEQPSEQLSEQSPEGRLASIINNFPTNPENEDYDRAVPEVKALFTELAKSIIATQFEIENYGGVDDLVTQTEDNLLAVLSAVPPHLRNDQAFRDKLELMPLLYFSGNERTLKSLKLELEDTVGNLANDELQAYFNKIETTAKENPEIIQEYSGFFQKLIDEMRMRDRMEVRLDGHTLGDFFFSMKKQ